MYMLKIRFQTYIEALTMLKSNDSQYDGVLLDRSIFSDWVFAKMNYDDGNISEEGYKFYMETREKMLEGLPVPLATIYLKVSVIFSTNLITFRSILKSVSKESRMLEG
jgi:deoxyadenosine/deoxycytidine kinase